MGLEGRKKYCFRSCFGPRRDRPQYHRAASSDADVDTALAQSLSTPLLPSDSIRRVEFWMAWRPECGDGRLREPGSAYPANVGRGIELLRGPDLGDAGPVCRRRPDRSRRRAFAASAEGIAADDVAPHRGLPRAAK